MIIVDETVGERIKKLRKMHNFTQKQVADYLGFKQTQIAKLESNDRYSKEEFKFRSSKDLDLNTLANMNRIIRNLKELNELNGD